MRSDFLQVYINAIPLAVISSAIVIPSIHHLSTEKKDFLTYEAVFSDILGIMLFNLILTGGGVSLTGFLFQSVVTLVISIFISFILVLFIHNMKTKTKVFIILSLLILNYAIGKLFHQSSLLLVFAFGLILGNYSYLNRIFKLKGSQNNAHETELLQFKQIVDESAFLIRTFFLLPLDTPLIF